MRESLKAGLESYIGRAEDKDKIMRCILITGANSYIGTSVERWLREYEEQYEVATIDIHGDTWKDKSFAGFDTVFHVVGIAHSDLGNVSDAIKKSYYAVNCDLAVSVAEKAKESGIGQFVFMSSIIVYGNSNAIGKENVITDSTKPHPDNFYGDSKLQAEKRLMALSEDSFKVAIIRAPMIYGKGSKGNYNVLSKIARFSPVFPNIKNQRSMIHIDNLCEFVRLLIDSQAGGFFFPQNKEYVCTSEMVKMIATRHGRKICITPFLNYVFFVLRKLSPKACSLIDKAFGTIVYQQKMSEYEWLFAQDYRIRTLAESINLTEQ